MADSSVFLLRSLKDINEKIPSKKMTLAILNGFIYINSFMFDVFEIIVLSKKNYSLKEVEKIYFDFDKNNDNDDDIYDHNWDKMTIKNY